MRNHQLTLISDFYKHCHAEQFPNGLEFIDSYLTPRKSRVFQDYLIVYGIQGFCFDYLIERFQVSFFDIPWDIIEKEYIRVISNTFTKKYFNTNKMKALHELGYLPIKISCLEEGTKCPMGVPMLHITNTVSGYAWLVQFLESVMSAQTWYPMTIANQAYNYREIVNRAYNKTVSEKGLEKYAITEMGFRGAEGSEGAVMASSAFLTSFAKTATVEAILYLEDYYFADIKDKQTGSGMLSSEHSCTCMNFAVDGNEEDFYVRMLTEIYPDENLSMVCDSYDYDNVVRNIICSDKLVNIIKNRKGTFFVRGDSGNPVDIICGKRLPNIEKGPYRIAAYEEGTVDILWNKYGGTVNSKGYKVLDPHIRAIYADGITPKRAKDIYDILEYKGFAANNVVLGAGSFSMQSLETDDGFQPFTRDTYGIAIKATHAIINGKSYDLFKDPKSDTDKFKKSHKGLCVVVKDLLGRLNVVDRVKNLSTYDNLLIPVFEDGKIIKPITLKQIRNNIHEEF